jgi:predicted nucleotidyltransferase component of viral defense system
MIPRYLVESWREKAPWQNLAMVEQDLIISRALVELYNQPLIRETLAFRGGTALNKLHIDPPQRYSEDIDLVQIKAAPIGQSISEIRNALDGWLGEPRRNFTNRSAKLIYRYTAVGDVSSKLKIEINTTEHFHANPLQLVDYKMDSEWSQGQTRILTYSLNELMGTKLRALYQRRKGRDLFGMYLRKI